MNTENTIEQNSPPEWCRMQDQLGCPTVHYNFTWNVDYFTLVVVFDKEEEEICITIVLKNYEPEKKEFPILDLLLWISASLALNKPFAPSFKDIVLSGDYNPLRVESIYHAYLDLSKIPGQKIRLSYFLELDANR